MPLFKCTTCGCVENTAVGDYWNSREAAKCSECSYGKWHGRFQKEDADANGWIPDEPRFPEFLRKSTEVPS